MERRKPRENRSTIYFGRVLGISATPLLAQWVPTSGPYGGVVLSLALSALSGTNLFTGTNGVFLTTDNGASWTAVDSGLTSAFVKALAVSGTNLFAGNLDGGVFLSNNNGTSWTAVDSVLTNTAVWSLVVSGTSLFAGTGGRGVWRRPLSQMTSAEVLSTKLPAYFSPSHNYLNPFNPSTKIEYQLPGAGHVTLKVYDMLGREVTTLVNEIQDADVHLATFDGTRLASGVYLCHLTGPGINQAKKMLLTK